MIRHAPSPRATEGKRPIAAEGSFPADIGKDQTRNNKLQIHACAHKRVSVFNLATMINHSHSYGTETPVNLRGRSIGFRVRLLD